MMGNSLHAQLFFDITVRLIEMKMKQLSCFCYFAAVQLRSTVTPTTVLNRLLVVTEVLYETYMCTQVIHSFTAKYKLHFEKSHTSHKGLHWQALSDRQIYPNFPLKPGSSRWRALVQRGRFVTCLAVRDLWPQLSLADVLSVRPRLNCCKGVHAGRMWGSMGKRCSMLNGC